MKRYLSFIIGLAYLLIAWQAWGATVYVDNTLAADCDGAATHYDPTSRACVAGAGVVGYDTLDEGVMTCRANAAADTVYLMPSTTNYTAVYRAWTDDSGDVIRGYSTDPTAAVVDVTTATRWLDVSGDYVEIAYLTIQNSSHSNGPLYCTGAAPLIHDNVFVDNAKHIRCLGISGPRIYNNRFRGAYGGAVFGLYFENTDNLLIYNNIIEPSAAYYAGNLTFRDTAGDYCTGVSVVNNVITGTSQYAFDSDENGNIVQVRNNVIFGIGNDAYAGRNIYLGNVGGFDTDYNLILPHGASTGPTQTHAISGLPGIVDYARYGIVTYSVDDSSTIDYALDMASVAEEFGYRINFSLTPDDWSSANDAKLVTLINAGHEVILHGNDNWTNTDTGMALTSTGVNPTRQITADQSDPDPDNWTWQIILKEDGVLVALIANSGVTIPATYTAAQVDTLGEVRTIIDGLANWAASAPSSTVLETKVIKPVASGAPPYTVELNTTTGVVSGFTMSPFHYVELVEDKADLESYINALDASQGGSHTCPSCVGYSIKGVVSAGNGINDALADAYQEAGLSVARGEFNHYSSMRLDNHAILQGRPVAGSDWTTAATKNGSLATIAQAGGLVHLFSHNTGEVDMTEARQIFGAIRSMGEDIKVLTYSGVSNYFTANGSCIAGCGSNEGSDRRLRLTFTGQGDYRLKGAPAVDSGVSVFVLTDRDGKPRPTRRHDLGPYEYRRQYDGVVGN